MKDIPPEHIEIGKTIMQEIMLDAGAVNHLEKEKYPVRHLKAISITAGKLFDQYPLLLSDENIEILCIGEEEERVETFGGCEGYYELNIAIGDYFSEL